MKKACEVVANTVRQETQKEDIKILDDYSRWLLAPERTADKKLRDYAVKRLGALKEKLYKICKSHRAKSYGFFAGAGTQAEKILNRSGRKRGNLLRTGLQGENRSRPSE